jgi:plastocyanin
MSKGAIVGIVVAVVVLAGGGVLLAMNSNSDDTSTDTSTADTSSDTSNDTSGSSSSADTSSDAATTSSVEIKDHAFTPANITVKKGTKVTWTNRDSVQHNVMTDTEGRGPSGELLSQGESYSYTFDEVGTFKYHCTPHPDMQGSVTVTE